MQSDFFSSIASLDLKGNLRINIRSQADGELIVSVLLANDQVQDQALQLIPPLVLKGSATELDQGFFETIRSPLSQTSALITNMSAYENAVNKAQKESRQEKDSASAATREKENKRKKFEEQMKKVEELEKQKKIGEAIGQLPSLQLFPEFVEEIRKRSQFLRSQHGALSLFGEDAVSDTESGTEIISDKQESAEVIDPEEVDNLSNNEPEDFE